MYWLIEPEISSSATIGGSFTRGPEIFQIDHRAAGLHAGAQGAAHIDELAAPAAARAAACAPARAAAPAWRSHPSPARSPPRVICAKSFFCSTSRSDTVSRASTSISRSSSRSSAMPENNASCTRCAPASGGLSACGWRLRQHRRDQLFEIAALAEEHAERLIEQDRMLVPFHEYRVQRPVEIVAISHAARPAQPRAHRAPRRGRPACRPRAARARSRRCCRRAAVLPLAGEVGPAKPVRVGASFAAHSDSPPSRGRERRLFKRNVAASAFYSAARSSDFTSSSSAFTLLCRARAMSS